MKRYCPACGAVTEWESVRRKEVFEVKGEKIEVQAEYLCCANCKAEYEDLNRQNDPYEQAYIEYRKRKGMVQPEEIKTFRKKYDLTQRELSELLGLGDITLSRYENGALQDEVHDKLLRLAMEPGNLKKLVEEKQSIFAEKKRNRILEKLENETSLFVTIEKYFGGGKNDIYNGCTPLNLQKVIEVIKFFTYNREIYKTKLFKLLFYSDFKAFKNYGNSITGLQYARLPFGPVPDNHEMLLGFITNIDNSIKIETKVFSNYEGEILKSFSPPNQSLFSSNEKAVLEFINAQFERFTSVEISNFSHIEEGYKQTSTGQLIPYSYAEKLQV
ncbi:MAG: type II TA system antitoxin MqsA family protein [Anaerolineaceae bacterium]